MPFVAIRGNRLVHLPDTPVDPTWTSEDRARHLTLQARFPDLSAELLQCWVWKAKVPGLTYTDAIESQIVAMEQK